MTNIQQRIIDVAKSYIGKRELPNNGGWSDKDFEKKMIEMGWNKGDPWCALEGELIWKEAYGKDSQYYPLLDRLFSASATATAANFIASKDFETGMIPKPGALAIWRHGKGWTGHLGVVVSVKDDNNNFDSVEGNTNSSGGREGIETANKQRKAKEPFKLNGLNLICFVYPKE